MKKNSLQNWIAIFFLVLLANTAWVTAFSSATVFYMTNVLVHLLLGVVLSLAVLFTIHKRKDLVAGAPVALGFFLLALIFGLVLAWKGNVYANLWLLWSHIAAAGLGVLALIPYIWKKAAAGGGWLQFRKGFVVVLALLFLLPAFTSGYRKAFPDPRNRIANPLVAPISMDGEGGGPHSPFFPFFRQNQRRRNHPLEFLLWIQETCGECHKKICTRNGERKFTPHHFASFNNQFYRKAIENMQETQGTTKGQQVVRGLPRSRRFLSMAVSTSPSKIRSILKKRTPVWRARPAMPSRCMPTASMGNGGFTIEYPALHQLMTSKNRLIKTSVDFMTYLNPEPHRKTRFSSRFMTAQSSEFCSSCHKVHLEVPVNHYRWFRGFNDYDNWQASGFGDGARSFYYPKEGKTCAGCHMPLEPSSELGSKGGQGHSHSFVAANTSVSHANLDSRQTAAEQKFLTSGFITVDIFAALRLCRITGNRPT